MTAEAAERLVDGVSVDGEALSAAAAVVRKASNRESHLTVTLREGKNREVRRLLAAIGHPVTRLRRVQFGGLELGTLAPGTWRRVSGEELRAAFPRYPFDSSRKRARLARTSRAGARRFRNKAAASRHRRPRAPPDRPQCRGSAFSARRIAGIATPSRHAKIIDNMIARKIAPATTACPRHANTTSPTTAAQPSAEQRRGLEFLPQRGQQPLPHDRTVGRAPAASASAPAC